jgi:CyaY protein
LEAGGEGGETAADEAGGAGVASVSGPFCPQADKSGSTTSKEPAVVITTRRGTKLEWRSNIARILPTMPSEIVATPLTDSDYHAKTAAVLASVEAAIDRWLQDDVVDIDSHRTGGLLELNFPNGSVIVLNTQPPLQELWMAARSGGFHYKHVAGRWLDREGREFFEALSACASEQAGAQLRFTGP